MKQQLIPLAVALALTGCAEQPDEDDYMRVCGTVETPTRVEDWQCGRGDDRYA